MGKLMGIKFQMIPWSYLMGNHILCRSGFISEPAAPSRAAAPIIKVIKSDGMVKIYDRPINVSALTVKFPKHKVCSSDSLYIGQKISALPEDDELQLGHTYFLLPINFFQSVLTFVTVTSFAASKAAASSNCQLFEIQKTESGFLRIRVREEFISRLMMMRKAEEDQMITKMMMTNDNNNNKSTRTGTGTGYNTRTNIEKEKREDHHQEEENSSSSSSRKNKKNMMMSSSSNNSRVCTTPELQKEYRQLVLIGRRRWKPKLDMIKESRNSEKKSSISSSSRKVLLIPASFRLKKRSSSSSITSTTSAPTDNNISSSSSSKSSSRSHKTKKKKSSLQSSSEPPPPAHHVPITSSTSTTSTTASTKPSPAATKHKVKSSKRVYS